MDLTVMTMWKWERVRLRGNAALPPSLHLAPGMIFCTFKWHRMTSSSLENTTLLTPRKWLLGCRSDTSEDHWLYNSQDVLVLVEKLCDGWGEDYYLGREYFHGVYFLFILALVYLSLVEKRSYWTKTKPWSWVIMDPRCLNLNKVGLGEASPKSLQQGQLMDYSQAKLQQSWWKENADSGSFQFP